MMMLSHSLNAGWWDLERIRNAMAMMMLSGKGGESKIHLVFLADRAAAAAAADHLGLFLTAGRMQPPSRALFSLSDRRLAV
jgi:hypothetical protein